MKRLALLFALLALPAWADDFVARSGKDTVRLTQDACPGDILALVRPELHEHVKASHSVVDGNGYAGCWAVLRPGFVSIIYADGDQGMVPLDEFKREPGV